MAIVVNKPLPEFEANATGGLKVSNTSHNGKIMILYFYPKDNTPGCTTEAMQFRDKFKDFAKAGATNFKMIPVVTGVSSNGLIEIQGALENQQIVIKNAYTLLMKLKNSGEE